MSEEPFQSKAEQERDRESNKRLAVSNAEILDAVKGLTAAVEATTETMRQFAERLESIESLLDPGEEA